MNTSHDLPDWLRQSPAAGRNYHAMKQAPGKHNALNITAAVALWGAVVLLLLAGAVVPWPVYIPVAGILLGSLYFGHFILIIHECSHDMFLLSQDRKRQKQLNRAIGMVAGAMFFTDYLQHWEKGHRIHHLRPCEPDDPQDREPKTGAELYPKLALLLIPGVFVATNPSNQYGFSLKRVLAGLAFTVPVVALTWLTIGWQVPAAMLVGMHWVSVLNLLKKAQEHGCGLADEPMPILRSRTYFYPLQRLMSPFNINYHFEHHANFSVPWYLLPRYHKDLLAIVPEDLQPYYFHRDYVKQLQGTKVLPPRELLFPAQAEAAAAPAK